MPGEAERLDESVAPLARPAVVGETREAEGAVAALDEMLRPEVAGAARAAAAVVAREAAVIAFDRTFLLQAVMFLFLLPLLFFLRTPRGADSAPPATIHVAAE